MVIEKDCSITENFVSEYTRLCNCVESCVTCPLHRTGVCEILDFVEGVTNGTYKTLMKNVAPILQDWYDANPIQIKTRLEDLLEKYPGARLDNKGIPDFCYRVLDRTCVCNYQAGCAACWKKTVD